MIKERLEEIINNLPYSIRHEGNAEKLIEYAKEQTERVQELEETVEDYKTVNKELHLRGRKVRKQNKRYREAMEFYANEGNYKPFDGIFLSRYQNKVDEDGGEKARKALEESQ